MFKHRTYSEQLDRIEIDEAYIKAREAEELLKQEKQKSEEIEQAVHEAFKGALNVVGNRLSMKKYHDTMYEWRFKGIKEIYVCSIFAMSNQGIGSNWELTESHGHTGYYNTPINLIYLSLKLIEWVTLNLKTEGIELE